jgi:hypothetical protein
MANLTFNRALGRLAYYADLPTPNDAFILVPLEETGLETDAVLRDKDSLADVLSGSTNEAAAGRKTLTGVVTAVDDVNDRVTVDADNVTWSAPTGNRVGAVAIFYDPDTTTGTDADLIPLTKADLTWTPDGIPFTLTIADLFRSSSTG